MHKCIPYIQKMFDTNTFFVTERNQDAYRYAQSMHAMR